tara:strand:+ start:737 stop:997 length:261 start_codon:yes stop_codon:yes gene_type:complete
MNKKLNDNINEETALINSLPFWKYFLIYIPLLFLMFATAQFIASFFLDIKFEWISILIQAFCFAIFFRTFHYLRKLIRENWRNKYN